ncbi:MULTISPECIES: aldehyde dehydrogenase family protein [unclassified Variovorax]
MHAPKYSAVSPTVVATVAPWNFPITQAVTKIGPALAAGNDFSN